MIFLSGFTVDCTEAGVAVQMSVAPSLALLTLIKTREGERIEIIKSVAPTLEGHCSPL